MHTGRVCGLLTGAILAAGVQARQRFDDDDAAIAAAVLTGGRLAQAFRDLAGSVNCGEITGIDLTTFAGRLRYIRTGTGSRCGRLHLKWGSRANEIIEASLSESGDRGPEPGCANCAVTTFRSLADAVGLQPGDSVVVAGLAGGVGLLGNLCGALAAGVIARAAERYLGRAGAPRDSWLRGGLEELVGSSYWGEPSSARFAFAEQFGSDLCLDIVGRRFASGDDHSEFIRDGGCREIVNFVVRRFSESGRSRRTSPSPARML